MSIDIKHQEKNTAFKFQSFLESVPDAIVLIDEKGSIKYVNFQTEVLFGYNKLELIGKKIELLMPTRFKNSHQKLRKNYMLNPKIRKMGNGMELFAKHKNLSEFPVEISLSNLEIEEGLLICASIRDVSSQKSIEKALKEAIIKSENAVKSKQQFLSNMSHEIRTPMNAIIGFTKVILNTELTSKQREYLTAIKMSGDTLIVLINDILDLAKVDSGKLIFEKTPFKLAASIKTMLHLFEAKFLEKNLELIVNYDSRIPEVIMGDAVRLHQIIINLVSNAIKFTSEGSITIGVQKLSKTDDIIIIEFSVADTGIGIGKNNIDKIFENFQQAHSQTSRIYGGTGLGLAIVKQLVEAQGGSISVKSVENQGSVFSFILQFDKAHGATVLDIDTVELVDYNISGTKVLVVEDVELNQLLMKTLLDDLGFECDIVGNGKIAIESLERNHYDIVLMDIQMPVMNGFQAADYIRNTLQLNIPIIALTADVTTVDLEKCKTFGMNDFIAKPVDDRKLFNKIINLLKKSKSIAAATKKEEYQNNKYQYIDMTYLNMITKSNAILKMEMINLYLKQTPILLNSISQSYIQKDFETLKTSIHKLIPSFSIVGINDEYSELAQKIGSNITSNQLKNWIQKLENACNQAIQELKTELKNLNK
jgi:PAS domain S-box-containing protein